MVELRYLSVGKSKFRGAPCVRRRSFHCATTITCNRPSQNFPLGTYAPRKNQRTKIPIASFSFALSKIDKSQLAIAEPKRLRDKAHLKFVASQPCLICGRQPSDPHHLRFAQPGAIGLKVSDEFTVPLCRTHHRQLHQPSNEVAWWEDLHIDATEIARGLWQQSRSASNA